MCFQKFNFFWGELEKKFLNYQAYVNDHYYESFVPVIKKYKNRRRKIIFKKLNSGNFLIFCLQSSSLICEFYYSVLKLKFFPSKQFFQLTKKIFVKLYRQKKKKFPNNKSDERTFLNLKKISLEFNLFTKFKISNFNNRIIKMKKRKGTKPIELFFMKKKIKIYIFHLEKGFKKFFRKITFFLFWINFWEEKKNLLSYNPSFLVEKLFNFLMSKKKRSSIFQVFKNFFLDIKTFLIKQKQSFYIIFQSVVQFFFSMKNDFFDGCFMLISNFSNCARLIYKIRKTVLIIELLKGNFFDKNYIKNENRKEIVLILKHSIFSKKIPNKIQKIFTLNNFKINKNATINDWSFIFFDLGYIEMGRKIIFNMLHILNDFNQIELIKKFLIGEIWNKNFEISKKILVFLILKFFNQNHILSGLINQINHTYCLKNLYIFLNNILALNNKESHKTVKNFILIFINNNNLVY